MSEEEGWFGVVLGDLSRDGRRLLYWEIPAAAEPNVLHTYDLSTGLDTVTSVETLSGTGLRACWIGGTGPGFITGTEFPLVPEDEEMGVADVYAIPCGN